MNHMNPIAVQYISSLEKRTGLSVLLRDMPLQDMETCTSIYKYIKLAPDSGACMEGMGEAIYDSRRQMLQTILDFDGKPFVQRLVAKTLVLGVNHFCNPVFQWVSRMNKDSHRLELQTVSLEAYLEHSMIFSRCYALFGFFRQLTPALLARICRHICKPGDETLNPFIVVAIWHYFRNVRNMTMLSILYSHASTLCHKYIQSEEFRWLMSSRCAWLTALAL